LFNVVSLFLYFLFENLEVPSTMPRTLAITGITVHTTAITSNNKKIKAVLVAVNIWLLVGLVSGPAEALFQREYYALLKAALRRGGILISQGMLNSVIPCI